EEDSPYPEVRAIVHNYDKDVPCNTIRAWTLGMTLVFVGASMNTLFSLRVPFIGLVILSRQFNTFGLQWSLSPGPFNIKEHSIIVVIASVSFSATYVTDIILAQIAFYKQDFGLLFQLMLTISTQSIGYVNVELQLYFILSCITGYPSFYYV
ncbi:OPT oligopeptide transporter protein-domain-containing protein, partial [Leptodontidium sp. MPI-SDFR-AT-0119]